MHAWDPTMNHPSAPTYIKQHYSSLLLAFENRLTMGAPHHSIPKQRVRPAMADQAATNGSKKAAKDSSRGAEKVRGVFCLKLPSVSAVCYYASGMPCKTCHQVCQMLLLQLGESPFPQTRSGTCGSSV